MSKLILKSSRYLSATFMAAALMNGPAQAEEAIKVVTSIKPIHSLVSVVMGDVGEPSLILEDRNSPHGYKLKPSEARLLEEADAVFWVGEEIERFLEKAIVELAKDALSSELINTKGLVLFSYREDAHDDHEHADEHDAHKEHDEHKHEEHDHAHGDHDKHEEHDAHAGHDHGEKDGHIWLSPKNASVLVHEIAHELGELDPQNADKYEANADAYQQELAELTDKLAAELETSKGAKFLVFHDAYQYFEKEFGLSFAGSLTLSPETKPGAARLKQLEARLVSENISCIFSEPQFDTRLVNLLQQNSDVRSVDLDPIGDTLEPGKELYAALLSNMAASYKACLSPSE